MDSEEAERRLGTVLRSKWKLERLLGVGGMAAAYLGVHKIGRREAIKILHPEMARSRSVRERFEREARAANMLKHPAVVEIHDIDVTEDGLPFLVMELVEGESLARHVVRSGSVDIDEVLRCMEQLLDGLSAAHARGIIHRDIKPSNLIVQRDGQLKVLDFGIARVEATHPGDFRTETGVALGTTPYMSPEQIRGEKIDGRADLFSVGATIFRLISGRPIHQGIHTDGDLLIRMATEPAGPLEVVAPGTPGGVCRIVACALELNRERRYSDAATMRADVLAVRGGDTPAYAMERLAEDAARGVSTVRGGLEGRVARETGNDPVLAEAPTRPVFVERIEPTANAKNTELGIASTKPVFEIAMDREPVATEDNVPVAPVLVEPTKVSEVEAVEESRATVVAEPSGPRTRARSPIVRWGALVGAMLAGLFAVYLLVSTAIVIFTEEGRALGLTLVATASILFVNCAFISAAAARVGWKTWKGVPLSVVPGARLARRWAVWGAGMVLIFLAQIAMVVQLPMTIGALAAGASPWGASLRWVMIACDLALGLVILRVGWRMGRSKERAARATLAYANRQGGIVSVAKLAAETELTLSEAAAAVEMFQRAGSCETVTTTEGEVVVAFRTAEDGSDPSTRRRLESPEKGV